MNNKEVRDSTITSNLSDGNVETLTLGMGCFWSPESLFGHLPGVVRTRVGYAGGSLINPTYHEMGDHTETVQIDFDPEITRLKDVLNVFWDHHNPVNINDYKGSQYKSLLLYRDDAQKNVIHQVLENRKALGKGEPATSIEPDTGFHLAEDRHQKYYLKRYPNAVEKLSSLYPSHHELINATLAARLNGLAKGYTNLARIIGEIEQWPMSASQQDQLIHLIKDIRW